MVELAPSETGFGASRTPDGIDPNTLHWRQVNDDAVVAQRVARDVVPTAAHRHK